VQSCRKTCLTFYRPLTMLTVCFVFVMLSVHLTWDCKPFCWLSKIYWTVLKSCLFVYFHM